jgi:hypothetical protein
MKQVQVSGGPLGVARINRPQRAPAGDAGPRLGSVVAASRLVGKTLAAALIVETIAVASLGVGAGTTIAVLAAAVLLASLRLTSGPRPDMTGRDLSPDNVTKTKGPTDAASMKKGPLW